MADMTASMSKKWCVITGAGRGLGKAIAEEFARNGAKLILVARSEDQLNSTAAACKDLGAVDVEVYTVDLTDPPQIDRFAEAVLAKHTRVDILVNNAGGDGDGTGLGPLTGDPDFWESTILAVNLHAPMRLTRRFSPAMKDAKCGLIINIASTDAMEPTPCFAAYCAAKFGLRGWNLSCHSMLREHGVKMVLICPDWVNTPLVNTRAGLDVNSMLQPEDVAEACMLAVRSSPVCVPETIVLRNMPRVEAEGAEGIGMECNDEM